MARGRRVKRERVEGGLRQGCIEGEPQTLPLSSLSLASSQHTPLRFQNIEKMWIDVLFLFTFPSGLFSLGPSFGSAFGAVRVSGTIRLVKSLGTSWKVRSAKLTQRYRGKKGKKAGRGVLVGQLNWNFSTAIFKFKKKTIKTVCISVRCKFFRSGAYPTPPPSLCLGPSLLYPVRSIDRFRTCRYPSFRDAERSGPRRKLHALQYLT